MTAASQQNYFSDADVQKWRTADYHEVISFVENGYHQRHRQQLPELIKLAQTVEQVHADSPNCPAGSASILDKIYQDLDMHMRKEEQILFQMIKAGQYAMARMPIQVMLAEHDEAEEDVRTLLTVTRNLTLPEGACGTWQALYSGIEKFIADLHEHIYFENEIFFPRVCNEK
ncbi:hemerythrin domain-containing protein [Gallibacterium anatis]|jgi:regulator of cell morphogenesis and NO signaling|uniref:Regulator of cell morphogenesis and NO signaling n=2 Tax=Gallibacterium anatis TaxID=750 RepID=U1I6G7_9PAST|nr:hemerythrin domain-containing protein [Gallibacterium anatis]ERF77794.1 regulator of cell morphogenesis and NO signaling [Gallibacterium anatis 12656/12]KGQ47270.1 regulator of cell morphoproteinsis and NO signaling [Gallibacterium anatis]KGQ55104.1 regulator of cell morphoproteinsis and NO signaling [Gallibacterium anatis str. Avicor]KGQ59645.1 regulator of cell morphoproteinsis and NO signaling [Gallibacterium anatis 4895]MDK9561505.1 hemerythrin domain-containing protein [Gallibacterium 